jgi:ABC-type transport system substrate-binding protein
MLSVLVMTTVLTACGEKTVEVTKIVKETVVEEKEVQVAVTATPIVYVNSLGVQLPSDAAPLEKQVWPQAAMEGKNFDYNKNIYEWNSMGAEGFQALVLPDSDWNFYPGDAETWETSADGLTWTFHMNSERKWSDGSPVTAPPEPRDGQQLRLVLLQPQERTEGQHR